MMKNLALCVVLSLFNSDDVAVAGFQLGASGSFRPSSTTTTHSKGTSDGHDGSVAMMMERRKAIECMAGITSSVSGSSLFPDYSFAEDIGIVEGGSNDTSTSVRPAVENVTEIGVASEEEVTVARDEPAKEEIQNNTKTTTIAFTTFNIVPDASEALDPKLVEVSNNDFLKKLATPSSSNTGSGNDDGGGGGVGLGGSAIWLGEHHNSIKDHRFQSDFIRQMHSIRTQRSIENFAMSSSIPLPSPIAIGLEQVQIQFQQVLDDYIDNKIDLATLRSRVEWDKRWMWNFDGYSPIFETARELNIRLLALNVDSEDLAKVERGGYQGLPLSSLRKYIQDPIGFGTFAQEEQFKTYANYVISPSYDIHEKLGLLQYTISGEKLDNPMSFSNFLSGRILWDEGMATTAYNWLQRNPGGLMIGLVGADHVKFQNGIPGRFSRLASTANAQKGGCLITCNTVIINPTLIDTRPAGAVSNVQGSDSSQTPDILTLQLRYENVTSTRSSKTSNSTGEVVAEGNPETETGDNEGPEQRTTGGVLPLSDYIVVTA